MAICPIHGVDHDLEDNNGTPNDVSVGEYPDNDAETVERLEAAQSRYFQAINNFPMDHEVVDISRKVRLHLLPSTNPKYDQDMREDVIHTLTQLELHDPSPQLVDVYFPVPVSVALDTNPEIRKMIPDGMPPAQVEEQLKKSLTGQTFKNLQYNNSHPPTIDFDATMSASSKLMFLFEGLIDMVRDDPFDHGSSSVEDMLAQLLGVKNEQPKRSKKMLLAYSIFTPLIYTIVHEWGHVSDHRTREGLQLLANRLNEYKQKDSQRLDAFFNDMSEFGFRGNDSEGYAEAYVEWVATNGESNNEAMTTYAEVYNWDKIPYGDWDFPVDVVDFTKEVIKPEEVIHADNNPYSF
jgi:hypothetical protein